MKNVWPVVCVSGGVLLGALCAWCQLRSERRRHEVLSARERELVELIDDSVPLKLGPTLQVSRSGMEAMREDGASIAALYPKSDVIAAALAAANPEAEDHCGEGFCTLCHGDTYKTPGAGVDHEPDCPWLLARTLPGGSRLYPMKETNNGN